MINTTFLINGGSGRVINSIPALEKYAKLNPEDDFKVLVHGWECVFWSHPILQHRVFGFQKGNFENYIKNNRIVCPEPYQLFNFYNQKSNLIEAFDECINNTTDHSDLNYNCLYLSDMEKQLARDFIGYHKHLNNKKKSIVFQPFGSGVRSINKQAVDPSNRSFLLDQYFKVAQNLNKHSLVLFASPPEYRHPADNFTISFDDNKPYLRTLMGLISESDFFVGVCSVGQHMARALGKPGLVVMGGTNENNFSYKDHFTIFRKKDRVPIFSPWRVSDADVEFADRKNDGLMNFSEGELNSIIKIVNDNILDNSQVKLNDTLTFSSNYS